MPTSKSKLHEAIKLTLRDDWDLIALGAHEQAIAHRIAVYLESNFPQLDVDCEYNRNRHDTKRVRPNSCSDKKSMRPDIIVHHRNLEHHNDLAVELKAKANPASVEDAAKLFALKTDPVYRYSNVAFVCIENSIKEMKKGILRATVSWLKSDGQYEEVVRIEDDSHVDDVKAILEQRRFARRNQRMLQPHARAATNRHP